MVTLIRGRTGTLASREVGTGRAALVLGVRRAPPSYVETMRRKGSGRTIRMVRMVMRSRMA